MSTYTQASLQDQVAQLACVVMKHEDQINTAKLDRGFVLFLHNGEGSILQTLFDISQKTKQALDNGKAQENPLRILLLKALFVELEGRLKMLDNDPQALATPRSRAFWGTRAGSTSAGTAKPDNSSTIRSARRSRPRTWPRDWWTCSGS